MEFDDERDAEDAVHGLDGIELDGARIIVEHSHGGGGRRGGGSGGGGGGGDRGGSDECFSCGGRGHWYAFEIYPSWLCHSLV